MTRALKGQFVRLVLGFLTSPMMATTSFSEVDGGKRQAAQVLPIQAEISTSEEPRTQQGQFTPQDHLKLAEIHRQKAIGFRREALEAQKKFEKESRALAHCPKCGPNLRLNRMTAEYKSLVRVAVARADEQDRLAQYHLLLAKEMQEHP
jgi:hypothetical protein